MNHGLGAWREPGLSEQLFPSSPIKHISRAGTDSNGCKTHRTNAAPRCRAEVGSPEPPGPTSTTYFVPKSVASCRKIQLVSGWGDSPRVELRKALWSRLTQMGAEHPGGRDSKAPAYCSCVANRWNPWESRQHNSGRCARLRQRFY